MASFQCYFYFEQSFALTRQFLLGLVVMLGMGSQPSTLTCYQLLFASTSNTLATFIFQHSCCFALLAVRMVLVSAVTLWQKVLFSSKDLDAKVAYDCFSLVKVHQYFGLYSHLSRLDS